MLMSYEGIDDILVAANLLFWKSDGQYLQLLLLNQQELWGESALNHVVSY